MSFFVTYINIYLEIRTAQSSVTTDINICLKIPKAQSSVTTDENVHLIINKIRYVNCYNRYKYFFENFQQLSHLSQQMQISI